ncbi:MAG: SURF1 family cytochrome oxidase biogenesis protein [Geminicoccaceae bacterium]
MPDIRGRRFRAGWPLTLTTVVAFAVLMVLGTWQVQRLAWKLDLISRTEAGLAAAPVPLPVDPAAMLALDLRPVTATGTLLRDRAFAYGASQRGGQPGARLMVPLQRGEGGPVLVDMGWIPEPVEATLAAPDEPGPVAIEGILRADHLAARPTFRPENRPDERRWYWLDTAALETTLDLPGLAPVTLVRSPSGAETTPPIADRPTLNLTNNHLGYAITWYGLGAGLVAVYIAFGLARGKESTP